MTDHAFDPAQQEYLKGFWAGIEARRGTLAPEGTGSGAGTGGMPPDALRAAQDAALAAGGTLTPQEAMKRERHPLDRWGEITARAAAGRFPKPLEDFAGRWHGLFYVAPAEDAFMCRLRIPGGILSAHQMERVAAIAGELAGGHADITTRANLQLRGIGAAHGPEVVMRLGEIGLLPRGTGADNIRNITASPTAGIDPQALIDPRPIVRALHRHILNARDLSGLPRKFNIAVGGGGLVEVLEETNDIALAAVRVAEGHGLPPVCFRLNLGGITGHRDFARATGVVVPPADAVAVCDAVLRVFIAHGDRTDRKRARLKYLLDAWGIGRFLAEVEAVLGRALARVPEAAVAAPRPPAKHGHVGIHAQAQPGLRWIGVVLPVGRLTAAQMRGLAAVAAGCGSGEIRLTVWQNLLLPGIPDGRLDEARDALRALDLGWEASTIRGGLVACTGNAGCKFAASNTKRHALELAEFLEARIAAPAPVNIHLTGCHHSCAQHYVADIGLLGAKVERGEELIEGYDLHVGGGAGPEQRIGRLILPRLAAEAVGPHVLALLRAWQAAGDARFQDFCAARDDAALAAIAAEGAA